MYLAYLDDSGDPGVLNSPTRFIVVSCVLVHESQWLDTLDLLIGLRRELRDRHGIPMRAEIKAKHLVYGRGAIKALGWPPTRRMELYRRLLRYERTKLAIKIFGIAIEKRLAEQRGWQPHIAAWTFALQRINRFCGQEEWAVIFPDQGQEYFLRRLVRHMRRYHVIPAHYGPGTIQFPIRQVIEDPNERPSSDSYFVQLADWNAYAAHRSQYVDGQPKVPGDLWDELGDRLLLEVTSVRGGPPGIVYYP